MKKRKKTVSGLKYKPLAVFYIIYKSYEVIQIVLLNFISKVDETYIKKHFKLSNEFFAT